MKIKKIKIENYLSVRQLEIDFCEGINVLIGSNSCGKTNIIKAVNHCFYNVLLNGSKVQSRDSWFGTNETISFSSTLSHENETWYWDWSTNPKKEVREKTYSEHIGYYHYIPSSRYIQSHQAHLSNNRNLDEKFYDSGSQVEYRLREYVNMSIQSPERLSEISKLVSSIYPNIEKIYISHPNERDNPSFFVVINGFAFHFHQLSAGLQQLITMISVLHFSANSLILIDEPELHLNPKLIIAISGLIKNSSKKNGNQFIIATHSSPFLSIPNSNLQIIPLEYKKDADGYTTAIAVNISNEFSFKKAKMAPIKMAENDK